MIIEFLIDVFRKNKDEEFIVWNDSVYHYHWLINQIEYWEAEMARYKIPEGGVVAIDADFSPNSIALFLALTDHRCILVPLASVISSKKEEFIEVAKVEHIFVVGNDDKVEYKSLDIKSEYEFYGELRERSPPGLVLFSSGS